MEFKKKTIIWEDNNEPPKDYIWAKKDGKFYEYDYVTRSWVESKSISGGSGGSGSGEHGGSSKTGISEGLEKVYRSAFGEFPDGSSIVDHIKFPDAYAYREGNKYYIIEDDFLLFMGHFANGEDVIPLYKTSPYESNYRYEVKTTDKMCLFAPEEIKDLESPYIFFMQTMPYNENYNPNYYNTELVDVYTESEEVLQYYYVHLWVKTV